MERVQFRSKKGVFLIRLLGTLEFKTSAGLDVLLSWIQSDRSIQRIIINLEQARSIDSTSLGLIAQLGLYANLKHQQKPILCPGKSPKVKDTLSNLQLHKLFRWKGEDEVFLIKDRECITLLEPLNEPEDIICERAISAHKALMSLSEQNHLEFKSVMVRLRLEKALLKQECVDIQSGYENLKPSDIVRLATLAGTSQPVIH